MNSITEERLALYAKGYDVIPAQGKVPVLKGWPDVEITGAVIQGWETEYPRATTTAIRCGEVVAVDLDIDDQELADTTLHWALELLGDSPIRSSRGSRAALLYRTNDVVVKEITGKYLDGEVEAAVEVKGRRCLQNIAGPHSKGHAYTWDRSLPPAEKLVEVTAEQIKAFLDACKERFEAAGFALAAPEVATGGVVRDLTPEMVWGPHGTTAELKEECERHGQVRVCMAPVRPGAQNPKTGLASVEGGKLLVFDNATGVQHLEVDTLEEDLAEIGAALGGGFELRLRGAAPGAPGDGGSGASDRGAPVVELPDAGGRQNRPTWRNVAAILGAMGWRARFNVMTGRGELWRGGECLKATAVQHLVDEADQVYRIKERSEVRRILEQMMHSTEVGYHPMADWLQAVKWDGGGRIAALRDSVVTSERQLWEGVLKTWLVAVVQGVCGWKNPQKLEMVPILLGEQGIGKSSWVANLAPAPWVLIGGSLEMGAQRRGVGLGDTNREALAQPITELGEIEGIHKQADVMAHKAFLSRAVDTDRRTYQKDEVVRPRATCFIGTGNTRGVLHDGSGSRRFFPIWVDKFYRLDWGEKDQQQLWAEVYGLWKAGAQWWPTQELETLRGAQEGNYADEPAHVGQLRDLLHARARALPVEEWSFAALWAICDELEMPFSLGNPKGNGELTEWLNRHWHPRMSGARGSGWKAQKCWLVPIKSGEGRHPVIEATNKDHWLEMARGLSTRA